MECCSLPFSLSHFTSTKLLRPPPEKGRELAPFNQMWEQGFMNSIKVLSFSHGEAAPFPQPPKLQWLSILVCVTLGTGLRLSNKSFCV